eukprot:15290167-Alexandrium_andersonii.AAC.1
MSLQSTAPTQVTLNRKGVLARQVGSWVNRAIRRSGNRASIAALANVEDGSKKGAEEDSPSLLSLPQSGRPGNSQRTG